MILSNIRSLVKQSFHFGTEILRSTDALKSCNPSQAKQQTWTHLSLWWERSSEANMLNQVLSSTRPSLKTRPSLRTRPSLTTRTPWRTSLVKMKRTKKKVSSWPLRPRVCPMISLWPRRLKPQWKEENVKQNLYQESLVVSVTSLEFRAKRWTCTR